MSESAPAGVLCVFAKAPQVGAVKTRLGAGVGAGRAAELARAFLVDSWAMAQGVEAEAVLVLSGEAPLPQLDPMPAIWPQGEGDLGERLERAFQRALRDAPWALAIGTDSPSLPRHFLERAVESLRDGADSIVGPCDDGGYWCLGLSRCPDGLLADLRWSTDETGALTLERLRQRGFSPVLGDRWYDVDEPADLERLAGDLGDHRAPHTRRALEPTLGVVMPTWNEAARIGRRLDELNALGAIDTIVVVDAGSADGTASIAREHPLVTHGTARVIEAPRGRASQMNAGARETSADVLVFLHADCTLPGDSAYWIRRTLSDPEVVAGAFRTWTRDDHDRVMPWLHLADIRSRYADVPYGDQAVFVRRRAFERIGGFRDIPLMEDIELGRRLREEGKVVTVPKSVRVSGRRFVAHPVRDTLIVNLYPMLYAAGVETGTLARWYQAIR